MKNVDIHEWNHKDLNTSIIAINKITPILINRAFDLFKIFYPKVIQAYIKACKDNETRVLNLITNSYANVEDNEFKNTYGFKDWLDSNDINSIPFSLLSATVDPELHNLFYTKIMEIVDIYYRSEGETNLWGVDGHAEYLSDEILNKFDIFKTASVNSVKFGNLGIFKAPDQCEYKKLPTIMVMNNNSWEFESFLHNPEKKSTIFFEYGNEFCRDTTNRDGVDMKPHSSTLSSMPRRDKGKLWELGNGVDIIIDLDTLFHSFYEICFDANVNSQCRDNLSGEERFFLEKIGVSFSVLKILKVMEKAFSYDTDLNVGELNSEKAALEREKWNTVNSEIDTKFQELVKKITASVYSAYFANASIRLSSKSINPLDDIVNKYLALSTDDLSNLYYDAHHYSSYRSKSEDNKNDIKDIPRYAIKNFYSLVNYARTIQSSLNSSLKSVNFVTDIDAHRIDMNESVRSEHDMFMPPLDLISYLLSRIHSYSTITFNTSFNIVETGSDYSYTETRKHAMTILPKITDPVAKSIIKEYEKLISDSDDILINRTSYPGQVIGDPDIPTCPPAFILGRNCRVLSSIYKLVLISYLKYLEAIYQLNEGSLELHDQDKISHLKYKVDSRLAELNRSLDKLDYFLKYHSFSNHQKCIPNYFAPMVIFTGSRYHSYNSPSFPLYMCIMEFINGFRRIVKRKWNDIQCIGLSNSTESYMLLFLVDYVKFEYISKSLSKRSRSNGHPIAPHAVTTVRNPKRYYEVSAENFNQLEPSYAKNIMSENMSFDKILEAAKKVYKGNPSLENILVFDKIAYDYRLWKEHSDGEMSNEDIETYNEIYEVITDMISKRYREQEKLDMGIDLD